MIIRCIGAFCIIAGSGCIGLIHNLQYRNDVRALEQLTEVIRYMEQDLRYRQLPLPELLKNAMRQCDGKVLQVLMSYLKAIERQASADTEEAMAIVLSSYQCISAELCDAFTKFAKRIGQFDITGQLVEFDNLREEISATLQNLTKDQATKMRSHQTLALCAGAAVAILLM